MKAKEYQLLEDCVMNGVARGFRLAFKHTDDPSHELMQEQIQHAVMTEIVEWFDFEDPSND